jgi:NADH-quinone oxidoreductase subunit C
LTAKASPSLEELFSAWGVSCHEFRGQSQVTIPAANFAESMKQLRDEAGFDMLSDVTAVDLLEYGGEDRFRVVYQLINMTTGNRLEVRVHVNDPEPQLPSMYYLWRSADWLEREVYDMFGVVFEGHPNPKRLLLPEEFQSFPLRKDYPVKGRGERHNFPVITRAES